MRWAMTGAIVLWMALKVNDIGWRNVTASLPETPWYYILFVVLFVALPVSELPIFRLILGRSVPGMLGALIRKRVLNAALVGYSGELYLFLWVQARTGIAKTRLISVIKDNAILSALASAVVTMVLIVDFVITGRARWIAGWLEGVTGPLVAVCIAGVLIVPFAVRLRGKLFGLSIRVACQILSIHVVRILAVALLQATQWAVVLPAEPWTVWITFLTVQMVISRLPLVPNRDLLFLSAALEMSHIVDGPRAAMAGLLLAGGALTQGSNLLFFVLTSFERRRSGVPVAEPDAAFEDVVATPAVPPAI